MSPGASARSSQADGRDEPPVSLVIPVRDERRSLPSLLDCIRRQTYPPAEIIIVDGGSRDDTPAVARQLAGEDHRFRVLEVGDGTPGRNRNVGAEAARHDWIAFTDAGTDPEPTWLERLVDKAAASAADVVYGNYEPVQDSFFTHCAALAYPMPKVARPGGRMRGPSTASILLRRAVWQRVGGFPDMRAAEDLIFLDRLAAGGFTAAWAPDATVWWHLQPTLGHTFQKFALYSMHNVWAGRQWDWHHGVARQYAFAGVLIVLGALHTPWWLLGLPLGAGVRVLRSVWRRRDHHGMLWAGNPARLAGVGLILLTIDLATFVGWAKAKRTPPRAAAT